MEALKNSQIIVNDWTTFETIIQDRKNVTTADAISLNIDEI